MKRPTPMAPPFGPLMSFLNGLNATWQWDYATVSTRSDGEAGSIQSIF